MRYLDVCAGISASTVAWAPLGWKAAAYSEIEAAPRAVLAHHYPNTPLHGDFTTIRGDEYGSIDLLVGGTPCQDFSVAGLRAGLDGDRGNLSLEFLRLADRARPRWVVWENVPGVLSIDGGRAFGAILGGLGELGYGFAYRVLDAQFFGVPQRRRRVFVVGCAGDWRGAAAVLSERHSLSGHPAPRREAREGAARRSAWGIDSDCLDRSGEGAAGTAAARSGLGIVEQASPALRAKRPNAVAFGGNDTRGPVDVATARNAHGGPHGRLDFESETFVLMERGRGGEPNLEWRADGTANAILTPNGGRGGLGVGAVCTPIAFTSKDHGQDAGEVAPTLRAMQGEHANAGGQVAVAFTQNSRSEVREIGGDGQIVGALAADAGAQQQNYVAAASAVRRLTPRECERLQGFPDDYTLVPHRGKPMADGPRYKALGNSMAVPVMRWIGERIAAVDALTNATLAA